MTATDWKNAKTEYIAGGVSYRALAEKYGVSQDSLRKRASREGWGKEKKKTQRRVARNVTTKIDTIVTEQAGAIVDDLAVAKYTAQVFQDALKSIAVLLQTNPESQNLRNVESLANAINKNIDSLMKTCRLLSAGEERKLAIEERKLKLEEEKFRAEQKAREEGNASGAGIQVVFDGELEEYSE